MSDFSASIAAFAGKATASAERIRRTVAVELGTAIINDTPVSDEETAPGRDHGTLQGAWQTTLNTPAEGMPGRLLGAGAIAELETVAAQAKGDDTIVMRNNTKYGPRIEYEGWSRNKAPQGMVRINVTGFQRAVQDAAAGARS